MTVACECAANWRVELVLLSTGEVLNVVVPISFEFETDFLTPGRGSITFHRRVAGFVGVLNPGSLWQLRTYRRSTCTRAGSASTSPGSRAGSPPLGPGADVRRDRGHFPGRIRRSHHDRVLRDPAVSELPHDPQRPDVHCCRPDRHRSAARAVRARREHAGRVDRPQPCGADSAVRGVETDAGHEP